MKHIVLVGFMGAGKSTTGLQLAQYFGKPFYDLDTIIETGESKPITDLISQSESYFRRLETEYLQRTLQKPQGIIALGGGAFCQEINQDLLKDDQFLTIYLKMTFEFCQKQLVKIKLSRPLLSQMSDENWETKALELYKTRQYHYNKADFTFIIDDWPTEKLIKQIENIDGKIF